MLSGLAFLDQKLKAYLKEKHQTSSLTLGKLFCLVASHASALHAQLGGRLQKQSLEASSKMLPFPNWVQGSSLRRKRHLWCFHHLRWRHCPGAQCCLVEPDSVVLGQLLPVKVYWINIGRKKGLPLPFSFSFTSVSRSARGFASKSKFTKTRKRKKEHIRWNRILSMVLLSQQSFLHVDQGWCAWGILGFYSCTHV